MSEQKMELLKKLAKMMCDMTGVGEEVVELVAAGMQSAYTLGAQSA